jgi:choline dehydrogenase-like flavoprotein
MLEVIGATEIVHLEELGRVGHLMGTTHMGDDPSASLKDGYGRSHDHNNLFVAGSGLFPVTGTANPTLTIAALTFRTASELGAELNIEVRSVPISTPVS